jgi:hypothetical protein
MVEGLTKMGWWLGCCLSLLLCTATVGVADDRRWSPFDREHWEGTRTWRPDRDRRYRGSDLPDRFTIDKRGKCEVVCERRGREYKGREWSVREPSIRI